MFWKKKVSPESPPQTPPQELSTDVPLCTECQHFYLPDPIMGLGPRCMRAPSTKYFSAVSGWHDEKHWFVCSEERNAYPPTYQIKEDRCGYEGKFWKAKL